MARGLQFVLCNQQEMLDIVVYISQYTDMDPNCPFLLKMIAHGLVCSVSNINIHIYEKLHNVHCLLLRT